MWKPNWKPVNWKPNPELKTRELETHLWDELDSSSGFPVVLEIETLGFHFGSNWKPGFQLGFQFHD